MSDNSRHFINRYPRSCRRRKKFLQPCCFGNAVNYKGNDARSNIGVGIEKTWIKGKLCPVIAAIAVGNTDILQKLLASEFVSDHVHQRQKCLKLCEKLSPLHVVAKMGLLDETEILLSAKMNPNVLNHDGHTPLHIAVQKGDSLLVRLLLSHGADPNKFDRMKNTPLHTAASQGHLDIVRTLLGFNANVHLADSLGSLPIHVAARAGHFHIVHLLCSADDGCVSAEDKSGKQALHLAAENGHVETVTALLDLFGASIDVKDKYGNSPFHTLVLKPHRPNVMRNAVYYYATAKAFVQFGAKWCEKNDDGKSVLDLARENMFLNISDLLQDEMGLPSDSEVPRTIHVSTSSIENSPPPEVRISSEICQNKEQTKPKSVKNIPIKFLGSKESKDGRKNKSESDDGQPKKKKSTTKMAKRVTFSLDDVIDDEKSSREFHSSSSLSDVVDNKAPLGYIGNMDNEIAVYSADEISMVDEAIPVFTPTYANVSLTLPDVALTTDDVESPEKINTSSSEKVNTLSSEKINTSLSDKNNTSSVDVRISNSASNAAATSSINKIDSNVDVVPNKMRQRNDIDLKSWNRTSSNVRNPGQLESPVDVLDVVLCDEDFFEDYTSDDQLDAPTDSGDDQLDAPPDFVQYKFPSIFIAGRTAEHVSLTPQQPEPDLADKTDSVVPKYFSLPTKQKVTVLEIKTSDEHHEDVNSLPKYDKKVDASVVISTTKDVPKENELVLSSSLDSVNTCNEKQKIKKTKKKIKKKAVDGMDISLSEDTNSENLSQNIVLPQPTLVDKSEENEITSDKVQNIGANRICESQASNSLSINEVSDEKTGRLPAANDLIKTKKLKSKSDVSAEEGDLKTIVGSDSEGKVIRKKRRQRPVLVEVNNEGNENVEATEKSDESQRRLVARDEEQIQNNRNKTNSKEHIFETKILSSQRKETDIDEDFDYPSIHSNNLPVKNPTSSKETNIDDDTIDDMNMKFVKRTKSVKKSNSFKMAVDRSEFSDMTTEKPRIKPSSNKVKETDVDEIMEIDLDPLDSKSVEPNMNGFNPITQPRLPGPIQVENHSTSSQNGIEASNSKNTVTEDIPVEKNSLYSSENIDSLENVVVNTSALLTDFDENNDESSEDETSGEEYVLENETIEEEYALENTDTCGGEYMLECTTSRMKLFTIKELNSEDAEEEEEEEVIEVKSEERGEVETSENVETPKEEVNWDDLDTSELHTKPINAKEMLDIHPIGEVEQADVKTCNAGTELCSPEEMPTKIEEILKKNAEILHENEKSLKEKEEIIEAICKNAGSSDLKENNCEKKSKTRIRSFLETSFDDIEPVLSVDSFEGNGFEGGVISRTSIRTRRSKRMKSKERLMPDDAIKTDDFLHQQLPDIIKTAQGHDRRREETNIDDFSPNADERGNDFESLDRKERENKSLEIKKDENLSRQGIGRVSRRSKQDDKKTSKIDPTTEKSTKTEFLDLDHTSTGVAADNLEESLVQSSSQLKKKKNWANYSFDNSVIHKETEKNATKKLVNISFESASTPAELLPSQAKNPPARTAVKPFDATGKPPLGRSVNIWAEKRESMRESQAALASRSSNVGESRTLIKPSITPPTIMSRSNQLNMSDDSISRSSLSSTMSSASSVMRRTGESDSLGMEFKRQTSSSPQTIGKRRSQKKKMRSLSESRSSHSTSDDVSMREVEVKPIHISDTQKTFQDAAFECITASLLNQPKVQTRKPVPASSARDPNVVYTTGAYHPPVMVFRSGSGSGPENSGRAGNRGSLIVGEGKSESTF